MRVLFRCKQSLRPILLLAAVFWSLGVGGLLQSWRGPLTLVTCQWKSEEMGGWSNLKVINLIQEERVSEKVRELVLISSDWPSLGYMVTQANH